MRAGWIVGLALVLAAGSAWADTGEGGDPVPGLAADLDRLGRTGSNEGIGAVLQAAKRGDPSHFYADDYDLEKALEALPAPRGDDYQVALSIEKTLDALQKVGTTPAITAMIEEGNLHQGQFRFDVSRRVRSLGDRSSPALILEKGSSSMDLRRWSGAQLELMGKRVPTDAVQTKSEDVLVEVLAAFGKTHDRDALPVELSFTSSEKKRVREAARTAMLAYDKDALPKLREIYTNLSGRAPDADATADKVAHDIFAIQDKQRMADLDAIVDDGLKKQSAGDTEGAVAQFDRALAREPGLLRKREMVPAFVARADSLVEKDPAGARQALDEALTLDPETPRKGEIQGMLAYLDAEALRARGVDDLAAYDHVLELDPNNQLARTRADELRAAHRERESRGHEWAYGAAAALVVVCLLVLVGLRGKRRRATA